MKKTVLVIVIVFSGVLWSLSCIAAPEQILKATTSWDGGDIYYPKGDVEITSVILRLQPGQTSKFHCHPVPTMGYVLKGEVQVETKSGKTVRLKRGDPAVEVMRTLHRGTAFEEPVEILVFYAGAEGVPNTVLAGSELAQKYCD